MERFQNYWWEGAALLLAANSVLFGVLFARAGEWGFVILAGVLPALLLGFAVAIRSRNPLVGGVLATIGGLLGAIAFWMIYPVVLAAVVILGGLASGKFGAQGRVSAAG